MFQKWNVFNTNVLINFPLSCLYVRALRSEDYYLLGHQDA